MIGYLCAYLRYHHPYEFITAFLNNPQNNQDIKNGSELARLYKIEVVRPKFGLSRGDYMFDKERKVIAKGIGSVKFLNKGVADELYELSKKKNYTSFMELLKDIDKFTSLNSRQLNILILIDYFKEFGNMNELLRMVEEFDGLNRGNAKQLPKDSLTLHMTRIVQKYATDKKKDGSAGKNYIITDMSGILNEVEEHVLNLGISDMSFKDKIKSQEEYLGYIDLTTNKKEDMYKLLALEIFPLKKPGEEPWGYRVETQSVCTGKISTVNVRADIFKKNPISKMDIIDVVTIKPNNAGYYYIWKYNIIK